MVLKLARSKDETGTQSILELGLEWSLQIYYQVTSEPNNLSHNMIFIEETPVVRDSIVETYVIPMEDSAANVEIINASSDTTEVLKSDTTMMSNSTYLNQVATIIIPDAHMQPTTKHPEASGDQ